jgi:hypothetical protein
VSLPVVALVAARSFVQTAPDPFDVFRPCVPIEAGDVARLDARRPLVKVLPEEDGNVAVFGARRTAADGDRLVAWIRQIE